MEPAAWLLFFFVSDPCCDLSVTRMESGPECRAALQFLTQSPPNVAGDARHASWGCWRIVPPNPYKPKE